jgi:DNA-binding CsgD family transcriptional regulator
MVSDTLHQPASWRELVAAGIVANDLTASTIARCVGVSLADAQSALEAARREGVLTEHGIEPLEAARLVGELPAEVLAEVHTVVARYLLSEGPSRLLEDIGHSRSAGTRSSSTELSSVADQAASTSLSVGDYESARAFLEFANEVDIADPPTVRAQRLCRLGAALDGLGLVAQARQRLATAFDIAELEGDADTAVTAAVEYSLPVDWYAGDRRTTAQLHRAETLPLTHDHRVMIWAARAMAEMRIPVPTRNGHQVAWVTRPSVAQPLAQTALESSATCSDKARLLALLAWRSTHRAPEHLQQRRRATAEAFDVAQQLRFPGRQGDAAVMLAVDALESADRPAFDRALAVLRWLADVDGNPRLAWHAHAVAAGAAHLDGDLAAAERHRHAAREVGTSIDTPGWLGAELLLLGQELLARHDPDEITRHLPDDEGTKVLNPLGKLIVGQGHAVVGDVDTAERLLRRAMHQFDKEASWLLCLTRAVELALLLDLDDVLEELWTALGPWHDHVAVDSQAWFCDGPVSGWLALLAHRRRDTAICLRHLREAESVARRLGDVRTLERMATLRNELVLEGHSGESSDRELTEREQTVLQMLVDGLSNPQIADALAFSRSTIRNDLTIIYRKLGVTSRTEAAACAIRLGISTSPSSTGSLHAARGS